MFSRLRGWLSGFKNRIELIVADPPPQTAVTLGSHDCIQPWPECRCVPELREPNPCSCICVLRDVLRLLQFAKQRNGESECGDTRALDELRKRRLLRVDRRVGIA